MYRIAPHCCEDHTNLGVCHTKSPGVTTDGVPFRFSSVTSTPTSQGIVVRPFRDRYSTDHSIGEVEQCSKKLSCNPGAHGVVCAAWPHQLSVSK